MRKLFLLFLMFVINSIFGQNSLIETGDYTSQTKNSETLQFHLLDNKKFHLSFLSGTYEQVNDSIFFNVANADLPKFSVIYSKVNPKAKTITVDLGDSYYYQWTSIHIGLQKNSNTPIVFKSIKELLIGFEEFDYERKKIVFEIEPTGFIYFVEENTSGDSHMEKYSIPEGVSLVQLNYNPSQQGKLNLKGVYNSITKELTVSEGTTPLLFSKNPPQKQDVQEKPLEVFKKKNWTYPGKTPPPPSYSFDADTTAVSFDADATAVANEISIPEPKFIFKIKTENTLKAALKSAKENPNKFLVVFFDTNAAAKKEFDTAIENYQNSVQSYMYNEYNTDYDPAFIYLATDKDKAALKKMGINDTETIAIINFFGTKLYHFKGKIQDYLEYYSLSSMLVEMKELNALAQIDSYVFNKNMVEQDVKRILLYAEKYGKRNYAFNDVVTPVVDASNGTPYQELVTTDTTQVSVAESYDYSLLKEKGNVYKFKTSKNEFEVRFKQLLDAHKTDKVVDEDLVKIIISQLRSSENFDFIVFNSEIKIMDSNDYLALDYLLKFYDEIPKIVSKEYEYQFQTDSLLETILSALGRQENAKQLDLVLSYYDKLYQVAGFNDKIFKRKLDLLKLNQLNAEYLAAFEIYFNNYVHDGKNIIESLDNRYNPKFDYSWVEFKNNFANECNEAAWFIVEKEINVKTDELSPAIKWSQTSLLIEQNNYFYLDTLAQLYYKNGQHDLGTATEQKAYDLAVVAADTLSIDEFKVVLDKMKNGTY